MEGYKTMSKYVCDFESLKTIANNLKKHVSDMNTALSAYETNMQSDLSGWTGTASKQFLSPQVHATSPSVTFICPTSVE